MRVLSQKSCGIVGTESVRAGIEQASDFEFCCDSKRVVAVPSQHVGCPKAKYDYDDEASDHAVDANSPLHLVFCVASYIEKFTVQSEGKSLLPFPVPCAVFDIVIKCVNVTWTCPKRFSQFDELLTGELRNIHHSSLSSSLCQR